MKKQKLIELTDRLASKIYAVADAFADLMKGTLGDFHATKENCHVGGDVWSKPFSGSYEHKDENGNWVEGPALGHGSDPGFDYHDSFGKSISDWMRKKGI